MIVEWKTTKQLEKMLNTRLKRLEDYEKKINERSKYRWASAWSMNKAISSLIFTKNKIVEEIQTIQNKLIKFKI